MALLKEEYFTVLSATFFPIMHMLQKYRTLKLFVQRKIFLTHITVLLCRRHKI